MTASSPPSIGSVDSHRASDRDPNRGQWPWDRVPPLWHSWLLQKGIGQGSFGMQTYEDPLLEWADSSLVTAPFWQRVITIPLAPDDFESDQSEHELEVDSQVGDYSPT